MKARAMFLLPPLVVLVSLSLTFGLWQHEQRQRDEVLRLAFDGALRQLSERIQQRMASYAQVLHGAKGFAEAGGRADGAAFARYVDAVLSGPDHTGLRALALRPAEPAGDARAAIASAPVALGQPGQLAEDPVQSAELRGVMAQARDSGQLALSGPVRLGAPGVDQDEGVLLILPVYAPGMALNGSASRRAALRGWVWAAVDSADMMSSLYGAQTDGLDLRLQDGVDDTAATPLFASGEWPAAARAAALSAREYLSVAGRTWTLVARTQPGFERYRVGDGATIVAVSGLVLSVLLGVLTQLLVSGRARAVGLAQTATGELRQSEERYRQIVETASEGIWITDAQGLTRFINPRMASLLGVSADAMQGQAMNDWMLDPPAAALRPHGPRECRLRRQAGEPLWVSLSSSELADAHGQASGTLTLVADVSERRRAQAEQARLAQQLRESQKLEAVGTLAGGIAHDFNNILAAILGNVRLARQQIASGQDAAECLRRIDESGQRARSLVQQILTFSRRQAPALTVQPLQPLLQETARLMQATLPAAVRLSLQMAEAPLTVRADATQIQQVLMNLCTNAWHALPPQGGLLRMGLAACELPQADPARLGHLPAGAYARMWVEDEGCGMSPETLGRLFEPFFTTKPVGQGTGLGLSVVHGIVAGHQGAITVDSQPGRGSRFDVYLPLAAAADATPAPHPAEPPPAPLPGRGERIMLVDDDPAIVLITGRLLELAGFQVHSFEDPLQALEALKAAPQAVDLLLSDFNMPGLSGLALAQASGALRPGLPVIISSGHLTDDVRQAAMAAGVREVLQKEFSVERLPDLVRRVLDQPVD